jgi:SAM-dependent methyltransferase
MEEVSRVETVGGVEGKVGYLRSRPDIEKFYKKLQENTIVHNEGEWSTQIKANWKYLESDGSIEQYQGYGHDKTCIVIGASPALKKNVEALRDVAGEFRDKFILIAVNSVVKFLLDNGIKPDFILAVDCDEEVWTRDLSQIDGKGLFLLLSPFAWPDIAENWKGTLRWLPMGCPDEKVQKQVLDVLKAKQTLPGCGNGFNQAVLLAIQVFRCRNFIFVGSELSWKEDEKYYVDGKHSNDEENDDIVKLPTTDIFGQKVLTTTGHWMFKIWLEDIASKWEGVFINATEGGILGVCPRDGILPWIHQLRLKPAIAKILKMYEWLKDWRFFETMKYEVAWLNGYDHSGTWPIEYIDGQEVNTILEVGCGNGSGVKELVEKGYDAYGCDISPVVSQRWNGIADRCTLAFADKIPCEDKAFDLVSTDILEHVPLDKLSDTLKEIKRVGNTFLFHLDYNGADWKIKNRYEPHNIIRPSGWWRKEFKKNGLKIIGNPNHRTFLLKEK